MVQFKIPYKFLKYYYFEFFQKYNLKLFAGHITLTLFFNLLRF